MEKSLNRYERFVSTWGPESRTELDTEGAQKKERKGQFWRWGLEGRHRKQRKVRKMGSPKCHLCLNFGVGAAVAVVVF